MEIRKAKVGRAPQRGCANGASTHASASPCRTHHHPSMSSSIARGRSSGRTERMRAGGARGPIAGLFHRLVRLDQKDNVGGRQMKRIPAHYVGPTQECGKWGKAGTPGKLPRRHRNATGNQRESILSTLFLYMQNLFLNLIGGSAFSTARV